MSRMRLSTPCSRIRSSGGDTSSAGLSCLPLARNGLPVVQAARTTPLLARKVLRLEIDLDCIKLVSGDSKFRAIVRLGAQTRRKLSHGSGFDRITASCDRLENML